MPKISKNITVVIILLGVLLATVYIFRMYTGRSVPAARTIEETTSELEHAQQTQEEKQAKPYIDKLPVKTSSYMILYSSLKGEIVVIFNKNLSSVEQGKKQYESEIRNKLTDIGANLEIVAISWALEK